MSFFPVAHQYQYPSLNKPHIRYGDIAPIIDSLANNPLIRTKTIGASVNGQTIQRLSFGTGTIKILAWTQMHGDEPTATAAILDILNYLCLSAQTETVRALSTSITLHAIPMLNPDGADLCTRENGQNLDINRDAINLETPEGRLLHQQAVDLSPDIAFNLHDQEPHYAVGATREPATIAFLAPPHDAIKHINQSRKRAMQLIALMQHSLTKNLPYNISRYSDEYNEHCFGDTFAKRGISTILIESGAHYDDPNRQVARTANFSALLTAFHALANHSWQDYSVEQYWQIPPNRQYGVTSDYSC